VATKLSIYKIIDNRSLTMRLEIFVKLYCQSSTRFEIFYAWPNLWYQLICASRKAAT